MNFLVYNGEITDKKDINLSNLLCDSAFSIQHKIWYGFGGIPLFTENIRLLSNQIEALHYPVPEIFANKRELFRLTKRMLNKNKFYRSGYINFQFFLENEKAETLITSHVFSFFDFPFSEAGILITASEQKKHSHNKLNQFAFYNEILWKTALQNLHASYFESAVITNEKNAVCECPFANIFLITGKQLLTPALNTGCFNDTLRTLILETGRSLNLHITESDKIGLSDLTEMDEIFLASEQTGIRWVLGFENKRFLHHYSAQIHEKLNAFLKEKATS